MGNHQPFMYDADSRDDSRFPATTFDPKAVTRASWEPKPKPGPKRDGPLLSFNRHPDSHMVLPYRSHNESSMNPGAKSWIKYTRVGQVVLRVLELNGAAGITVLMVLLTNIATVPGWVLRIAPGVVVLSCLYAIYHLTRDAAGRPPASSAAYQFFSMLADLCILGVYAFGAYTVAKKSDQWKTRLSAQDLVDYFVPAVYYTFLGAGGLHFISLLVSGWLGYMFRRISLMPPDMNPLESHLTARPSRQHQRNKSSVATLDSIENEKRLSTPLESHRRSGLPYEDLGRAPTIPFMHTRTQSRDSASSRASQINLPARQYQIMPGNASRASVASVEPKRLSNTRMSQRGSYAEVPRDDEYDTQQAETHSPEHSPQRVAKFTEAWKPTDSLISRTNHRNREVAASRTPRQARNSQAYSALTQGYNVDEASDSEGGDENDLSGSNRATRLHPNPLRSNPPKSAAPRAQTPLSPWKKSLSEISGNTRRVSNSRDIADETSLYEDAGTFARKQTPHPSAGLYSRPYGELKSATPPVMVGDNRKVSSGNDYGFLPSSSTHGRRNVSGKLAEEGLAGQRNSRYRSLAGVL